MNLSAEKENLRRIGGRDGRDEDDGGVARDVDDADDLLAAVAAAAFVPPPPRLLLAPSLRSTSRMVEDCSRRPID